MKKQVLIVLGLIVYLSSFAQTPFLTEKKNIKEVREIENQLQSVFIGFDTTRVQQDYFPGAVKDKDYYPIKFKRTNDDFFPELFVHYYYDENDSSVVCASYDWEIMNYVQNIFTDGHRFETEQKRKKEYLKKYKEVKKDVINSLGEPDKIDESKGDEGYFYKLEWFKEDIDVLILFSFSTKLKAMGPAKFGSYRIRLKLEYK
ncbi:hypothetical protein [Carboxylicivirga sp. RSCT41]|uniref:hypothetical protein n=1 Tax=Carboxylicivirga agarovorans TaxID=3417570 RepID=UPI003D32C168